MFSSIKPIRLLFCLVICLGWVAIESYSKVKSGTTKSSFELNYQAWVEYRSKFLPFKSDIDPNIIFDNKPFREIVELGIPAIPYIIEKQQEDHALGYALYKITKWKYHVKRNGSKPSEWIWFVEEFPDIVAKDGSPDSRKIWQRWWEEGPNYTKQAFQSFHKKWKIFKEQKRIKQAQVEYNHMVNLGIAAIPYMIDKVKEGDTELIAAISDLTDANIEKSAKRLECLSFWDKNKKKWLLSFPEKKQKASIERNTQDSNAQRK